MLKCSIDINYIWLPNKFFNKNPKKGEVYRVKNNIFKIGYQYANDIITIDEFDKYNYILRPNKKETRIFKNWEREKINEEIEKHAS